jgi:hypothetical protein
MVGMSGDGNFHMHAWLKTKGLHLDPSVYGDHGFFAPYELTRKYAEAAESLKAFQEVCVERRSSLKLICGLE